jgi:glycosyltransferase involved in cell wall biosynthesis
MLVTLNIMSYKYGHLAGQAIESALNQSKPFHIIRFFDDGAHDCEHLVKLYPEVEFVLRPKNIGIINNFNDALDRTETEHVMYLGADNWLDWQALEMMSECDADIVSPHAIKIGNPQEYWAPNQPHGTSLYRVDLAKAVGGYEASGNEHTEEDSVMFGRMRDNGASFEICPEPLLYYRWRHRSNYNK